MLRVLQVVGSAMDAGGAETLLMDIYRNIDRNKIQFDFLVHKEEKSFYDDEILLLGGRINRICSKEENIFKYMLQTAKTTKGYNIVHIHASCSIRVLDAICALITGAKVRIIHSHNTSHSQATIHKIVKILVPIAANYYFACSSLAGEWMFGKKIVAGKRYKTIKNAINAEKFIFNRNSRDIMRKKLDIGDDTFVLGHVGRFVWEKNHTFLLDVFSAALKNNDKLKLVLVGDGELRGQIEDKILALGIKNKVILLGVRKDVAAVMQAFDLLVFPSLSEGLGTVAIEAQAAGLGVIAANVIPKDINVVPELVTFLPINNADRWARVIVDISKNGYKRKNTCDIIVAAGYDVNAVARWYERFYLGGGVTL